MIESLQYLFGLGGPVEAVVGTRNAKHEDRARYENGARYGGGHTVGKNPAAPGRFDLSSLIGDRLLDQREVHRRGRCLRVAHALTLELSSVNQAWRCREHPTLGDRTTVVLCDG